MSKSEFVSKFVIDNAATIEGAKLLKAAEDAWKKYRAENGATAGGYINNLMNRLIEGRMEETEVNEWLKENNLDRKKISRVIKFISTANKIHDSYIESEETEE